MAMPEPVSFQEADEHLRLSGDESQRSLVEAYITAAREWVENYTGHVLVRRKVVDHFDRFSGYLELTKRPIVRVEEVSYTGMDGAKAAYPDFVASIDRPRGRVYPALNGWWPTLALNGTVSVTYTAGYAEGEVPKPLRQAILLLVGDFYAVREASTERPLTEAPFAVRSLCDQYRSLI